MSISFWLDRSYESRPPLIGSRVADAVVVGAGITGAALGCFLGERKIQTLVLERGTVAGGASGRNAGFLVSGLSEHYARSLEFWGRESAALIFRLHLENHALLAETIARYEIDCDHALNGSFVIAADEDEEDLLRRSLALQLEDGLPGEFVDSSEIQKSLLICGFRGGLFNRRDGCVDPVRLTRGLASIAQENGCAIFEHTGVDRIRKAGTSWILETRQGRVTAPLVFLASNAWTPELLPHVALQPVRGQCLAVGPLELAPPPVPCYANYGSEYWRGSGRYMILGGMRRAGGAGEDTCTELVTEMVQMALDRYRSDHFPGLRSAPTSHRWSGIMSYSRDGLPLIGQVPGGEGMLLAAGYTGHGLGWVFLAARWLVSLAVDGTDEIPALCRPDRNMRLSPSLSEI